LLRYLTVFSSEINVSNQPSIKSNTGKRISGWKKTTEYLAVTHTMHRYSKKQMWTRYSKFSCTLGKFLGKGLLPVPTFPWRW
jgi:hypothetical protein